MSAAVPPTLHATLTTSWEGIIKVCSPLFLQLLLPISHTVFCFYHCSLIFTPSSSSLCAQRKWSPFWSSKQHPVSLRPASSRALQDRGRRWRNNNARPTVANKSNNHNNNNNGAITDWCFTTSTSFSVIFIIQLLLNQLLKVIKRFIKSVSITGSLTAADYNQ